MTSASDSSLACSANELVISGSREPPHNVHYRVCKARRSLVAQGKHLGYAGRYARRPA